jgi:dihydrodipicolinate synthase/N-acetylneuraminate lyase
LVEKSSFLMHPINIPMSTVVKSAHVSHPAVSALCRHLREAMSEALGCGGEVSEKHLKTLEEHRQRCFCSEAGSKIPTSV